jgi:hypothetical protein
MLFAVGDSYFLYTSRENVLYDQASASRLDALQQQHSENLAVNVGLKGSNLVVSLSNNGGVSTTISSIYLVNQANGEVISPPGMIGQSGTNVSAANWPLSLVAGASTASISGCIVGKTGCGIEIMGYTYSSGTVYVSVVTARGNVFTGQYPPKVATIGISSSALVVSMVATPTPPLTQVFSCAGLSPGCVTLTVTIYNFAVNQVTGVVLSPAVPASTVTGTVTMNPAPMNPCNLVGSSSTIPAYSGTGSPPFIQYVCTYDASTGAVGGYASFSGVAQGTLSGVLVSSAEAISNSLQIGANSNAITQGAFSINAFFFKASSCYQTSGGNWNSPCTTSPTTVPPKNPDGLTNAGTFSVGYNYYVAWYVNVTNNFPSPLEILQYSFLQFDSSYYNSANPNIVGNEPDFWLAGTASAYNGAGVYYPNYKMSPPSLTGYTGNLNTCPETGPNWTPNSNCLDISTGHTVTLDFATCGFGSGNWEWGASHYGTNFDNSAGCDSSTPGWDPNGVASALTVVISYVYQGQIYTQAIQFQGQALVSP